MNKYYINITNKCDYSCPFCCMYSSPKNDGFMSFNTLYDIIEKINTPTVVQLEGGEPLLHPNIILFLEYLASKEFVSEIVIDTNAVHLNTLIDSIVAVSERNRKLITIKPSYNTYLKSQNPRLAHLLNNIISACEFLEYIRFNINVRAYNEDELKQLCEEVKTLPHDGYLFNRYGRAKNREDLVEPYITKVFDNWTLFAHDGTQFGNNLKARSEYEHTKISTNS